MCVCVRACVYVYRLKIWFLVSYKSSDNHKQCTTGEIIRIIVILPHRSYITHFHPVFSIVCTTTARNLFQRDRQFYCLLLTSSKIVQVQVCVSVCLCNGLRNNVCMCRSKEENGIWQFVFSGLNSHCTVCLLWQLHTYVPSHWLLLHPVLLPSLPLTDQFRVESTTGIVRVSGDVRFSETGFRSYELSIVARDRGTPQQSTSVSWLRVAVLCTFEYVCQNWPTW